MIRRAAPVAVTGMGCITAAGRTVAENIATLDAGFRAPQPPSLFVAESAHPVFMSALPGGDAAESGREADAVFAALPEASGLSRLSRTVRLAAHAALEALADAHISPADLPSLRVGVCLGTSVGVSLDFFDYYRDWRSGTDAPLDAVIRYRASNPALALARLLRLNGAGPVQCVANACSSGADAIGMAAAWIRAGLCDLALCGGADALARVTCLGFGSLRLTSPEACRPFDANRTGLNLGEGAGVFVLERTTGEFPSGTALSARPAKTWVLGYGTATDAHHLTAPHPEARGLHAAVGQALAQAGAKEADIAFINAHGTATPTNDAAEGKFFRERFPATPFVATKGGTGHTLGAAGAVEAVFSAAHLARGLLPGSPGFSVPDPAIGAAPVSTPATVGGDMALSQSLAFGGNNSVLLLGRGEGASGAASPAVALSGGGTPCP